jgi:hypothetical protein
VVKLFSKAISNGYNNYHRYLNLVSRYMLRKCIGDIEDVGMLAGRIAEYDVPVRLLENKDSLFARLVSEYTVRSTNSISS